VLADVLETAVIDGQSHTGHAAFVFRLVGGVIDELMRMEESSVDGHWARLGAPTGT
jgi:hypothetical protein